MAAYYTAKTASLEKHLRAELKRLISVLNLKNSAAEVFLLPSVEMKTLKERFLKRKTKKAARVDVLAFAEPPFFPNPDKSGNFLGEIYINREIAFENAERAVFLLIHGLLHLLHYSHDKKDDTIKMKNLEKRLVKKFSR